MRPVPAVTVPPVGNAVGVNAVVGESAVDDTVAGAAEVGDIMIGDTVPGDPALRTAAAGNSVRGNAGGAANAGAQRVRLNRNAGHAKFTPQALRRERGISRYPESIKSSSPVSSLDHVNRRPAVS
jgi:hypothetical protein